MKISVPFIFLALISTVTWSQTIDPNGPKTISYGAAIGKTLTNGRILLHGRFDYFNGTLANGIISVNGDGSIDKTFDVGTGIEGLKPSIISCDTYPDGKVIVAGSFENFNGVARNNIVRLNPNGSVDNTFAPNLPGPLYSALLQSTGKIIISGWDGTGTGLHGWYIMRLNDDGSIDNTFPVWRPNENTSANVGIFVLGNDDVMAMGPFTDFGGNEGANYIVKLKAADGSLDKAYHADISKYLNQAIFPDGSMIVSDFGQLTAKLNADGSRDTAFTIPSPGFFNNIVALSDGSFVGGGSTRITKCSASGSVITTIDEPTSDGFVYQIVGTDKLITLHATTNPVTSHVIRNADLTIDSTWAPAFIADANYEPGGYIPSGGPVPSNDLRLYQQPDGKLLVRSSGKFYTSGDLTKDLHPIKGFFRLNTDLSFDAGFSPPSNMTRPLLITSDGKMYVKLSMSTEDVTYPDIAASLRRLNPDGSIDNAFASIAGDFDDVAELGGGQLIGTRFGSNLENIFHYAAESVITRFDDTGNVAGIVDMFAPFYRMTTIDVGPDGKWYISLSAQPTSSLYFGGQPVRTSRIFRMNSNGTLDNTFSFDYDISRLSRIRQIGDDAFAVGKFIDTHVSPPPVHLAVKNLTATIPFSGFGVSDRGSVVTGHDVVIGSDYSYAIASTSGVPVNFKLFRFKEGGGNLNLNPYTYRQSISLDAAKSDQLYFMPDGSLLAVGNNQFFHIIVPASPSAAPTQLKVTSRRNDSISLQWIDNSDDESSFKIERSVNSGAFVLLASTAPNVITYSDSTIESGKTYQYRVMAVNVNGSSDYSNVVDSGAPAAPTDLAITSKDIQHVTLAWKDNNDDEISFVIERSSDNDSFDSLAPTVSNVTTYIDNSVRPGKIYHYRVKTVNAAGDSEYSNIVDTEMPPIAPTELKVSHDNHHVALTWIDNSDNETQFSIERAIDAGEFTLLASISFNVETYTDSTFEIEHTYHYRVNAIGTGGSSDYTNVVDVDVPLPDDGDGGTVTGLEDHQNGLQIYPNPVRNDLQIQSDEVIQQYTLIRMDGKTMETGEPNSKNLHINMKDYSLGMYIVNIQDSTGKKTLKILKQ